MAQQKVCTSGPQMIDSTVNILNLGAVLNEQTVQIQLRVLSGSALFVIPFVSFGCITSL